MEKNQQHNRASASDKETESFSNRQAGQQLPQNNETANANRFAETPGSNEQNSESSKPDAENQTLGTP